MTDDIWESFWLFSVLQVVVSKEKQGDLSQEEGVEEE